jgi:hypothetical protein
MNLDNAIYGAGNYIQQRLQRNSIVAIINFSSPSLQLTNYVIDGLSKKIVDDRILRIVERRNLEAVAKEISYQLSGDVSDASAKRIGQQLGADSVISGGITQLGNSNMFRMSFQITHIETAEIQGVFYADIPLSNQLSDLLPAIAINTAVPQNNTPPQRPTSSGDPNYRVYFFRNITQQQFNDLYRTFFDEAATQRDAISATIQDGGVRDPYIEYSRDATGIINIKIAGPYYSELFRFSLGTRNNPGSTITALNNIDIALRESSPNNIKALMARFDIEKGILNQKYDNPTFKEFFRE